LAIRVSDCEKEWIFKRSSDDNTPVIRRLIKNTRKLAEYIGDLPLIPERFCIFRHEVLLISREMFLD